MQPCSALFIPPLAGGSQTAAAAVYCCSLLLIFAAAVYYCSWPFQAASPNSECLYDMFQPLVHVCCDTFCYCWCITHFCCDTTWLCYSLLLLLHHCLLISWYQICINFGVHLCCTHSAIVQPDFGSFHLHMTSFMDSSAIIYMSSFSCWISNLIILLYVS
jgi:hypothetical protein